MSAPDGDLESQYEDRNGGAVDATPEEDIDIEADADEEYDREEDYWKHSGDGR